MNINRYLITLTCLTAATVVAGASEPRPYTIRLNDFNELRVRGPINVDHRISTDSAGVVVYDAPYERVRWSGASGKKGKMTINVEAPKEHAGATGLPTIRVYSTSLLKVENESDSAVRVLSGLISPTFSAKVIGNGLISVRSVKAPDVECAVMAGRGQLVISGECDNASMSLAGTGTIQADALKASNVSCYCTGTGSVGVSAAKTLTLRGAGSSTVYYTGDPVINKKIAVGLKLERLE